MITKTIRSSWWEGFGYRLDCQPYLAGALETKILLERLALPKEPLGTLTTGHEGGIYNGPQFRRVYVEAAEFGVPFVGSSSMLYSDFSHLPYLSKDEAHSNRLKYLELKRGMTLISCSGTIGKTVYVQPSVEGMWSSQHVMKVVADVSKVPAGYLYAYLSSKFGVPLLVSGTYGSIIQSIEPEHISNLPVPRFGKKLESTVAAKMEKSADLLSSYQTQIAEATRKFFSVVHLNDVTPIEWHHLGRDLGFEKAFPFSPSFRALNFSPRFQLLCERMQAGPWKPLGDLCVPGTLKRGGRYKRIDADPAFSYELIGQKELFHLKPEGRWIARQSVGKDLILEEGTIAVAAQGTLGETELYCRSEFVWGPWTKFAYSEHILRVLADQSKIQRGCLFAFMRSETAFRMLRSISSGTKLQDNHYYFLPRLPIPMPKRADEHDIHEMVVEAYDKRHRAVSLENEAIKEVETAIEHASR